MGVITRSIGQDDPVAPHVRIVPATAPFLMCSDGSAERCRRPACAAARQNPPLMHAAALIATVRANGAADNLSLILLDVPAVLPHRRQRSQRTVTPEAERSTAASGIAFARRPTEGICERRLRQRSVAAAGAWWGLARALCSGRPADDARRNGGGGRRPRDGRPGTTRDAAQGHRRATRHRMASRYGRTPPGTRVVHHA